MNAPMVTWLLVLLALLLMGTRPCTKHAQNACDGLSAEDPCEIDNGCSTPPTPGTCTPSGANAILTCIPN
ncbi:MAG: hypothetical protein AAF500_04535 [Myxococcota bacterium]